MNDPRPYIVTMKTTLPQNEGIVRESVDAYDVTDAMMRAAVRLNAREISVVKVLDVEPNAPEVQRRRAVQQANVVEALSYAIRPAFQKKMREP